MAAFMWLELIVLGSIIGSNNFAAALSLGALGAREKRWRILAVFALFEFLVPLLGLWLGRQISAYAAEHAQWLGPLLLAGLGIWTLLETRRDRLGKDKLQAWLVSWWGLITLAAGLSIDNLIVGFSLGLGGVDPLALATTIAVFSVTFSLLGIEIGARVRRSFETAAEVFAGCLLLLLALGDWVGLI